MEKIIGLPELIEKKISNNISDKVDNYFDNINDILNQDEKLINTIYSIISNPDKFNELVEISEKINLDNKKQILLYLIEEGNILSIKYKNLFKLNTNYIDIESFIEGIYNGGDELFFSDKYISFLEMYKNTDNIKKTLGIEGFFEQYDYFLLENKDLGKIKEKDFKVSLENFRYRLDSLDLLDKLNSYGLYDWNLIIENIFEKPEEIKKVFFDLFLLTKKEKQLLENLKVDVLNYEFKDEKENIINELNNYNLSLISSFTFNEKNIENSSDIKKFYDKLYEIIILKNSFNTFHITFFDITGRLNNIELTSDIDNLIDNEMFFEDKNIFYSEVENIFKSYIYFLEKNNFNFDILIFKSNGNKRPDNNLDYQKEKELKIA